MRIIHIRKESESDSHICCGDSIFNMHSLPRDFNHWSIELEKGEGRGKRESKHQ